MTKLLCAGIQDEANQYVEQIEEWNLRAESSVCGKYVSDVLRHERLSVCIRDGPVKVTAGETAETN